MYAVLGDETQRPDSLYAMFCCYPGLKSMLTGMSWRVMEWPLSSYFHVTLQPGLEVPKIKIDSETTGC